MIWAQDSNGGLGLDGKMAWHLPEDLKHFRNTTLGSSIVMGRKTWEGLPENAKPLKNRRNIVLSTVDDEQFSKRFPGAVRLNFDQILALSKAEDVFITGGRSIYEQFMGVADELIITELNMHYTVDIYAPEIPNCFKLIQSGTWQESSQKKNGVVVQWRIKVFAK
ncbi:MAG: dihydrofolate reductase [Candidatus Ancillula sp.]|nr:dihydrofolate reductase [Candidatus Ancillula sp.]